MLCHYNRIKQVIIITDKIYVMGDCCNVDSGILV